MRSRAPARVRDTIRRSPVPAPAGLDTGSAVAKKTGGMGVSPMGCDPSSAAGVARLAGPDPPGPPGPCLRHCGDSVTDITVETLRLLLLPPEPSPQARPPIASRGDAPFLRQPVQFCFDERPLIVGEVAGLQLFSQEPGPLGEPPLAVDDSLRHGTRLCPCQVMLSRAPRTGGWTSGASQAGCYSTSARTRTRLRRPAIRSSLSAKRVSFSAASRSSTSIRDSFSPSCAEARRPARPA